MSARATLATYSIQGSPARVLLDTIKTLGELLDDLESVRIANSNRIAALERDYGDALPHLDVIQKQAATTEHLAHLELVRAWRKHPLAPWAKSIAGLGEKSVARLVAIIGEPSVKQTGEPRTVAELRAYCGHGDPARRRAKGMTQEELFRLGNPRAKTQVWLIATGFVKQNGEPDSLGRERPRSPYRDVYEEARERYADRLHEAPCVRCGPSGHPALPGSPWSDAHKHAAALRFVGKRFLLDLWEASRANVPPKSKIRPPGILSQAIRVANSKSLPPATSLKDAP